MEVHHRIAKIDKLKKRYEIITMSMVTPEGEEEHSQAYHVIKVWAQNFIKFSKFYSSRNYYTV